MTTPSSYRPLLDMHATERAIAEVKEFFQTNLAFELNLTRVTAPLFVLKGKGINDDLNGVEKPVSFPVKGIAGEEVEVVQSLAKWKRLALRDLDFSPGTGLYTDMNAIRPFEDLDQTHSVYVDQWDWEKVITREDRHLEYLKTAVRKIYDVIRRTERFIAYEFPILGPTLPEKITFFHAEELEHMYPDVSPRERETLICKEHGAVFIIGIGGPLERSDCHDGRAPDYDDWITPTVNGCKGLNGDILVYNQVLATAYEISSMGIRVDPDSLRRQLEIRGCPERADLFFHRELLEGKLPLTMGGGIGQSRLCMFYLRKAHIGEIQASIWPEEMRLACRQQNIPLL